MTTLHKDQAPDALRTHFEALASDPSFKLSRSRRGTYVNPAVARDWKWFQLGASCAQQLAPATSDWDVRGHLAASLTCWHRLTGKEADELVSLFQGMRELAADKTLAYESVLAELVDKITGADSGDILADALAASKVLDERAAPAAGAVAGPWWKLVPAVVTNEMWEAYKSPSGKSGDCSFAERYTAMLAAAPTPDAQADSQPAQCHYSIDADPQGIRAMVADAITGALAFGAQGANPPPAGHWLAPFWNAARADHSQADSQPASPTDYPTLPEPSATGLGDEYEAYDRTGRAMGKAYETILYFKADQMRAYVDADREARKQGGV